MPALSCPICGKLANRQDPAFPFCSPRCRKVDLARWLNQEYTLADEPDDDYAPGPGDEEYN